MTNRWPWPTIFIFVWKTLSIGSRPGLDQPLRGVHPRPPAVHYGWNSQVCWATTQSLGPCHFQTVAAVLQPSMERFSTKTADFGRYGTQYGTTIWAKNGWETARTKDIYGLHDGSWVWWTYPRTLGSSCSQYSSRFSAVSLSTPAIYSTYLEVPIYSSIS